MHEELTTLLTAASPHSPVQKCERVAAGVVSIALGNVFMSDIEVSPSRNASARATAELLVGTLAGASAS
nr:hypothetical protein [Microbacterium bovistercoris]